MRKLTLLLLALAASVAAMGQSNYLTITTTNGIVDASGTAMAQGTFCVYATDGNDTPVAFSVNSTYQAVKSTICRNIVNGTLASTLQLANPAVTQPLNVRYHVTITNTLTHQVTQYPAVSIVVATGVSTWDWSNWNPALSQPQIPTNVVVGPAGATGPTGPAGATGPPVTFKGTWSSATSYNVGDGVSYTTGGTTSSYVALVANTNVTPVAGATWGLLAQGATGGASLPAATAPGQSPVAPAAGTTYSAGYPVASKLLPGALAQKAQPVDCYSAAGLNSAINCLQMQSALAGAGALSRTAAAMPVPILGYDPKDSFVMTAPLGIGGHALTLTSSTTPPLVYGGPFGADTRFGYCSEGALWHTTCQNGTTNAAAVYGYYISAAPTDFSLTGAYTVLAFLRCDPWQVNPAGSIITCATGDTDVAKFKEWYEGPLAVGVYPGASSTPTTGTLPDTSTALWSGYHLGVYATKAVWLYYSPSISGTGGSTPWGFTYAVNDQAESSPVLLSAAVTPQSANYLRIFGAGGSAMWISGGPYFFQGHLTQAQRAQIFNGGAFQSPPLWNDANLSSMTQYTFQPADWYGEAWNPAFSQTMTTGGSNSNLTGLMHYAQSTTRVVTDAPFIVIAANPGNTAQPGPQLGPGNFAIQVRVDGHVLQSNGVGGCEFNVFTAVTTNYFRCKLPNDGATHTLDIKHGFVIGYNTAYTASNLYSLLGGLFIQSVYYPQGTTTFYVTTPSITSTAVLFADSIPSGAGVNVSPHDSLQEQMMWNTGSNPFGGADIQLAGFGSALITTDCPQTTGSTAISASCKAFVDNIYTKIPTTKILYLQRKVNDYAHGCSLPTPTGLGQALAAMNNIMAEAVSNYASTTFYMVMMGNASLGSTDGCNSTSNPAITVNGVSVAAGANSVAQWNAAFNSLCAAYTNCKTIDQTGTGTYTAGGLTQVSSVCSSSTAPGSAECWPAGTQAADPCMNSDNLHPQTCGVYQQCRATYKTITGSSITASAPYYGCGTIN